MANDLNQCNFIGRLGKDPEIRFAPSGDAVANFSIAVGWKTKEKEGAEWVNCVAYGKLAEIIRDYLAKGSQVFISGKFRTEKWQDKTTGQDKYKTVIVCDQMQMLGGKREGQADEAQAQRQSPQSKPAKSFDDFEDDISLLK